MAAKASRPSVRDRLARDALFQTSADLPRVVEVDVAAIAANPEQPRLRIDADALDDLKASIERHGLLQPILVRRGEGGGFILVAGQRRLEAIRALGRPTAASIVVDGDPGEVALVENLQRQDLDPFEEARGVARLVERFGYSQTEVGTVIGKKQNTVSALLALNRLPETIRREHAEGAGVSRSVLVEIAQIADPAQQMALWQAVKGRGLTVRDLRASRQGAAAPQHPMARWQRLGGWVRNGRRLAGEIDALGDEAPPELVSGLQELHATLGELLGRLERPTRSAGRRGRDRAVEGRAGAARR